MVATDYCHLNGVNYLIIADRYSGWLSVLHVGKGEFDTEKLIEVFRDYFLTFGIAEEISSDMASQYMSTKFEKFLKQYGIHHRKSSSYFAHSNSRAELGVKSGKRILMDNMDPDGTVNNDRFLRAMLQYRNTPQPDTRLSPAQVVYGRYMRDFIPVVNDKYEPKQEWAMVREYREKALKRRLDRDGARLEQYTKKQKLIPIGNAVAVQNQAGRHPKKWDKTGVVVENMDHDKVLVRMDGSRRLTTRNRRFVRKILSPPDLPDRDVPLQTMPKDVVGQVRDVVEDEAPETVGNEDTPDDRSSLVDMQQSMRQGQQDSGIEMVGHEAHDVVQDVEVSMGAPSAPVPSETDMPAVERPKRNRRPNVKYSSEEYDLSAVSAVKKGLCLSGLYVKQCKPRTRGK